MLVYFILHLTVKLWFALLGKNSRIAHVEFYEAASAQRCVEAKRVNVKKSTVRVELAYSHWRPSWKAVKQRESQMWCGVASKTNESEAENARNGEETESEDTDYFSLLPDLCLERIFFYMSANERIVNERVCVRWRSILRSLWCRLRVFSFDTFRLPFACTITVDAYRSIIKRLRSARVSQPSCRSSTDSLCHVLVCFQMFSR